MKLLYVFLVSVLVTGCLDRSYKSSENLDSDPKDEEQLIVENTDTSIIAAKLIDPASKTMNPVQAIRSIRGLYASHLFTYEETTDIASYKLFIFRDGQIIFSSSEENSWLLESSRLFLRDSLVSGDILIFDEILFIKNNGGTMKLAPVIRRLPSN